MIAPSAPRSFDKPMSVARRADPGLLTVTVFLIVGCAAALSTNVVSAGGIKGDEATYASMALSAAYDGDLAFERADLERYWSLYGRGPEGIFLKRGKSLSLAPQGTFPFLRIDKGAYPRDDRLYFGKAYIYPIAAAPFVRLAGLSGLLLFHVLLIGGSVLCGYYFVAARSPGGPALLYVLGYLAASIAPIYAVWLTPELFNFALVFFAYFFWLYKEVAPPATSSWARLIRSPRSDLLAAALLGLVTFSKPLYVPLVLPLIGLSWWRRRLGRGIVIGVVFALVTLASFAANAGITGEFNYQGGDRKTFYGRFPFESPDATFDNRGIEHVTDGVQQDLFERGVMLPRLRDNAWYFLVGRHAGLLPYYFPALVALGLWAIRRATWQPWHFMILATSIAVVGIVLFMQPFTWAGGCGAVGNRYFIAAYPLFLFLTPPLQSVMPAMIAWIGGALFTAHILINPFVSSARPWTLAQRYPLRLLPVETTMINDLPVMVNAGHGRVVYGKDPSFHLYFLDDNAWLPELGGIWVAGNARTEIVVRSSEPLEALRVTVESPVPNTVTLRAGGPTKTVAVEPGAITTVSLEPKGTYSEQSVSYVLSARTSNGVVPRLGQANTADGRFLGAFLRLSGTIVSRQPGQ